MIRETENRLTCPSGQRTKRTGHESGIRGTLTTGQVTSKWSISNVEADKEGGT